MRVAPENSPVKKKIKCRPDGRTESIMEFLLVPAEEKVLPDRYPAHEERANSMAKDETFSFQLAFFASLATRGNYAVKIESEIGEYITCCKTDLVPCTFPKYANFDEWFLSDKAFLCPDVLVPLDGSFRPLSRPGWNALRFIVRGKLKAGTYPIRILLTAPDDTTLVDTVYTLTVKNFTLGESRLIYTSWFHYDAIAQYYHLPVFSRAYNKIMDDFIKDAVAHGMNMLLIPMFTPPLDTKVGSERLTVQLVDVTKTDDSYEINLDRLIDFMKHVKKLGTRYFEMSHLFSQWGAETAPKVMATTKEGEKRIFGWDTPALGGEYEKFLRIFLPALRTRLIAEGLYENCYFHLSDEPSETHIDHYADLRDVVFSLLPDAKGMDALSHYEFHERGLVTCPVVATNYINPFLENHVDGLWAYYCCGQGDNYLSNRLMAMPGERTRVLGFQLWLCGIKGFLQWGYNFYNSVLSERPIDPYLVNDGDGAYPSGDPFVVYPSQDGHAVDSVRHEIFYDAIQDYNLMCVAEEKIGREAAAKILTDLGFCENFTDYPHDLSALKAARRAAQDAIVRH